MPILNVEIRDNCTQEQKDKLIRQLTHETHKLFSIPLDKIIVLIKEIPSSNWGQAGVTATNSNYATLSRRQNL